MKTALLTLAILVGGVGCRDKREIPDPLLDHVDPTFFQTADAKKLQEEIRRITVDDGISAAEAEVIATTLFRCKRRLWWIHGNPRRRRILDR